MFNLINMISFLDEVKDEMIGNCLCQNIKPALTVVGFVIWGVKIFVPIALIVVGMIKLASAVTSKKDDDIKAAQKSLIQKLIISVVVFLVPTIVLVVMGAIGDRSYKACWDSIQNPGSITSIFDGEKIAQEMNGCEELDYNN